MNSEVDSDASEFECFMPCGSSGSWPASDVGDEFVSRSTYDSDFWLLDPE
jgi:hypothetical protein